jgi:uncharacterized protein YmfQ (DUF2313 family)
MTALSPWTAEDFADSFQRQMPTGPVWPREPDTTQRATIVALMPTYERSWTLARSIPTETLPSTAVSLLPEWEASVGLPDPCSGPDPTISQRQAHVVARLTQSSGPSIPSLTAYALALGYPITIQEYAPARYGRPNYGKPRYGKDWAFAWQITTSAVTITPAIYGKHHYGEPYRTWGGQVLECEMKRIKPAHTILLFNYTGTPAAGLWNEGVDGRDSWVA